MVVDETPQQPLEVVEISCETQAIIEQNIPHASDAVKQKTMELMEAIKRRLQTNLNATNDWDNEAYLQAVHSIQQHLAQSKLLSEKYEAELEQLLQLLEEEVQQYWQLLTQQTTRLSNRLKQAADNDWGIRPQSESTEPSNTPPTVQS